MLRLRLRRIVADVERHFRRGLGISFENDCSFDRTVLIISSLDVVAG